MGRLGSSYKARAVCHIVKTTTNYETRNDLDKARAGFGKVNKGTIKRNLLVLIFPKTA